MVRTSFGFDVRPTQASASRLNRHVPIGTDGRRIGIPTATDLPPISFARAGTNFSARTRNNLPMSPRKSREGSTSRKICRVECICAWPAGYNVGARRSPYAPIERLTFRGCFSSKGASVDWHESESPHLDESTLKALLQGQPSTPDAAAHFATCRYCQGKLRKIAPERADALLRSLAPLIRRLEHKPEKMVRGLLQHVASEVTRAKRVLDEILERPDPVASLEATSVSAHGLAAALLESAAWLRQYSPETLYELCVFTIDRLMTKTPPTPGMADFDLLTLLEAETGNALRVLARTTEAERWIVRALNRARSSSDPLIAAKTRLHGGRFYCEIACFEEAEILADAALRAFRALGGPKEIEEAEFLLARIPYQRGDLDRAMERLQSFRTRDLVGPITELSAVHHIAKIHVLQGKYFEGGALLPQLRDLSQPWWNCPGVQMNCLWLKGMIIGGTIAPARGAEVLRRVRSHYLDRGILVDAAMVSTDLAALQLHWGRTRAAASTALEAVHVFEAEPLMGGPLAYRAVQLYEQATGRAPRNGPLPGAGRLPGPYAT